MKSNLDPLESMIAKSGLPQNSSGYRIPAKRFVKIDVGLSSNAPQSSQWLKFEDSCEVVLGFEPSIRNLEQHETGTSPWPDKLSPAQLGSRVFVFGCALGSASGLLDFYETGGDSGRSSLYQPKKFAVDDRYKVQTFTLDALWSKIQNGGDLIITHLKSDTQGADLGVLKGAKLTLRQVLFVTSEAENRQYNNTSNSKLALILFMAQQGFLYLPRILRRVLSRGDLRIETDDPTFVNLRFVREAMSGRHVIWQRG